MGFKHGVYAENAATSLLVPKSVDSALPVIVGCAPIHRLPAADQVKVKPGKIGLVTSDSDAGSMFGVQSASDDFAHWTLSESTFVYFQLFNVAPAVFINIFDPAKHFESVVSEQVVLAGGMATLAHPDVIGDIEFSGQNFIEGEDYQLNRITGKIAVFDDSDMATLTDITVSYKYAAPEKVTENDCIGGYDVSTGMTTGLSLIDDVFPKYGKIPAVGLAPKFGESPVVAAVLRAKMNNPNGIFRPGVTPTDIPSDGQGKVVRYMDVPEYKTEKGLTAIGMIPCWPKVQISGKTIRMSLYVGATMAATDAAYDNTPYVSPSNEHIPMDGLVADGEEVWLGLDKANFLGENGITTANRFNRAWRLWGNRMGNWPASSDPQDFFIPQFRMNTWFGNNLILQLWDKVDKPMSRQMIESIITTKELEINGMVASGKIHGGRVGLLTAENPVTDLMNGAIKIHYWLGWQAPTESITNVVEFDPSYLNYFISQFAA